MLHNLYLIREILSKIEQDCFDGTCCKITPNIFPEYSAGEVNRNVRLIVERGLAKGTETLSGFYIEKLTWDGHDFLDNARKIDIWRSATNAAGDLSFRVFQKVLEAAATREAMKTLEM